MIHAPAEVFRIVPAGDDELIEHFGDHAIAGMQACGLFVGAPFIQRWCEADETFVRPPVVVPLELEDERFAGESARQS